MRGDPLAHLLGNGLDGAIRERHFQAGSLAQLGVAGQTGPTHQLEIALPCIHIGDVTIGVGSFINAIINFLIVAFVLFMVIKTVNALHKKPAEPEAPAEPTTKVCPYCQSEIAIKAVRCPHCTTKLEGFPEIND